MTVTTSTPARNKERVGWGDLAWLAWRQHRWQLIVVGGVAALAALLVLSMAWTIQATDSTMHEIPLVGFGFHGAAQLFAIVPMAAGGVIAVFWGAPLLATEYEHKTHVVAWGQDVSPTRWLLGKVVLLGVPAVGLAAGFGAAVTTLLRVVNDVTLRAHPQAVGYVPFQPFSTEPFEAVPLVQASYAAFGFALGLALSATTRRTVVAMAGTLGIFVVVRVLVGALWRPHYWSVERLLQPYNPGGVSTPQREEQLRDTMRVDSGFADSSGNEVPFPMECSTSARQENDYVDCLHRHDVVNYFTDYHPADRLVPFQLAEFAIFTLLAAGLVALAFSRVRRAHRG